MAHLSTFEFGGRIFELWRQIWRLCCTLMQQISMQSPPWRCIGPSSEVFISSKVKQPKLACPPNSNVDKCVRDESSVNETNWDQNTTVCLLSPWDQSMSKTMIVAPLWKTISILFCACRLWLCYARPSFDHKLSKYNMRVFLSNWNTVIVVSKGPGQRRNWL